jgi:hypothetical protein
MLRCILDLISETVIISVVLIQQVGTFTKVDCFAFATFVSAIMKQFVQKCGCSWCGKKK